MVPVETVQSEVALPKVAFVVVQEPGSYHFLIDQIGFSLVALGMEHRSPGDDLVVSNRALSELNSVEAASDVVSHDDPQ